MATNLTISSSSYAGELALPYISAAVLSGDTIANNYVTVKENVKYKMVLKTLASTGIVKAWGCDFDNADSTLTLRRPSAPHILPPARIIAGIEASTITSLGECRLVIPFAESTIANSGLCS